MMVNMKQSSANMIFSHMAKDDLSSYMKQRVDWIYNTNKHLPENVRKMIDNKFTHLPKEYDNELDKASLDEIDNIVEKYKRKIDSIINDINKSLREVSK